MFTIQMQRVVGGPVFAPAGLPANLAARLGDVAAQAMADPELRRFLEVQGLRPTGLGPQRMAAILAEDHARWGRVVRDTGFVASH